MLSSPIPDLDLNVGRSLGEHLFLMWHVPLMTTKKRDIDSPDHLEMLGL